ncbi:MAG: glycosyltransferase [Burkholderiaceae bacterium]|nr:glycosyltransferase [Burkholderiaceae bacterium]
MKVAFVITGLSTGGAETMLLKLLQHLDRRRFEPHVFSLTTEGEVGPRIADLRIPVRALGMRPGSPNPGPVLSLTRSLRRLAPDVVHTWMYHADFVGGLAARLAGSRNLAWGIHHSNLDRHLTKRSTSLVVKTCALLSSWMPAQILSCSTRARAVHAAAGYRADKIRVIPNGFDLERFRPDAEARTGIRAELGVPLETPLVGLIARYDPQKNHAGFIGAASLVRTQMPDAHFLLAGSEVDADNSALQESIRAHGLCASVHLLGRRDDVPRLMAALDVLASSSYGEAFPNVLGEAMACGVPCVVTDVGDSAEIVGDTGRVVQPGDVRGLADQIVDVLRLPLADRAALGSQARVRVQANYEIGQVAKLYEACYERLAAKSTRSNA